MGDDIGLLTFDTSGEFIVVFTALVKLLRIPEMNPAYAHTDTLCQPLVQDTKIISHTHHPNTRSPRPLTKPNISNFVD